MKKITIILAVFACSLFTVEANAQNGIRKGIVIEIETTEPSHVINHNSSRSNRARGIMLDTETGDVHPFDLENIEMENIKKGMAVDFILIPTGPAHAINHNSSRSNRVKKIHE